MEKKSINFENRTLEKDLALEKKFSKIIKAILGNIFISQDIKADQEEGTDFLILRVKPFRVAVRLRRFEAFKNYPNEFTIRWTRPSGIKTEIDKIREGLVDYMFYGFLDPEEKQIVKWSLLDLEIFRKAEKEPLDIFPNSPRDSDLAVYHLAQFPSEFVIKSFEKVEYQSKIH